MDPFIEGIETFNKLMPRVIGLPLEQRNKFIRQELGYPPANDTDDNPELLF
jgi:hypothetical protein